jgi:uncharacterized protein YxeA
MGTEKSTKLIYSIILLLVAIVGYIFANIPYWFANPSLLREVIDYFAFAGCTENSCFGTLATYRVASAATVFHALMALLLFGVKYKNETRANIQDGFWAIKIIVIVIITVGFFFIPNAGFVYYGYFALGGSFLFIIVQVVLLIDMAHSWSESWIKNYQETESKFWIFVLTTFSLLFLILSITGTALMYVFYTQENPGCWVNAMFITLNLVFCFLINCLSIHPTIQDKNPRSGLLQSSIVTLYCTYLVYSSIVSEPPEMNCAKVNIDPNSPGAIIMLIIGVIFTFVAIIYSAISTATTSNSRKDETTGLIKEEKEEKKKEKEEDEDEDKDKDIEAARLGDDEKVSYNYSFFHITFAIAVMYLCMVLTNWQLVQEGNDTFQSLPSISPSWIKVTSSWITLILFIWTLIAPIFFKNRVFNRE